MMDATVYLALRVLHILVAALWIGAAAVLAWVVMPALRDAEPAGGRMTSSLHRRKLHAFMAASSVLTVLSGLWLYWVLTSGLSSGIVLSRAGLIFGVGGLCGLLALILGGSVIGPGFARAVALTEQSAALPEAERAGHAQRIAALQQRVTLATRIDLGLIVVALVLMASGHYA